MVSKILITNTLENFLAAVAVSSLQHLMFCVTLQALPVVEELQQSWCLVSLTCLLELGELQVAVRKKDDCFSHLWNDSAGLMLV